MVYSDLLNVERLRSALIRLVDPASTAIVADAARFVAAFYLGLPLFEPGSSHLPTLFIWTQLDDTGLPGPPLSRDEVATHIPSEFSPNLPPVLLAHLGHELEAVLYCDHFDDKRSSLLLRMIVDDQLSLRLTDEYVAEIMINSKPDQQLQLIGGLIELDIVMAKNYVRSMEAHLIEKLELLYAQLPFKAEELESSRPPIYLAQNGDGEEADIFRSIHANFCVLIQSLSQTNRLSTEMQKTMLAFRDSEATSDGCRSILTRVAIIVLSLIYRDAFSLAAAKEWEDLPEIALKYRSLLVADSEDDDEVVNPFGKWKTLAHEQDLNHFHLFMQFVAAEAQKNSSDLPPLGQFTRQLWLNRLTAASTREVSTPQDWLSGVICVRRQVNPDVLERLRFVSSSWRGFNISDPGLIALRLKLTPSNFCRQAPRVTVERRPASARDEPPSSDRLFFSKNDLVKEYAEKGKELLARRRMTDRRTYPEHNRPRYMRSTVWKNLINMQKDLIKELDHEDEFLSSEPSFIPSPVPSSKPHRKTAKSSKPEELRRLWDDAIQSDLLRLNEKLDRISKHLGEDDETARSFGEPGCEVEVLETSRSVPDQLIYIEAPIATTTPKIERLDFSILSPPVSVGRRMSSPEPMPPPHVSSITLESSADGSESFLKTPSTAATFPKGIPINGSPGKYSRRPSHRPHRPYTERACQTDYTPSVSLADMRRLSKKDIALIINNN